jgi:hypothetical protein
MKIKLKEIHMTLILPPLKLLPEKSEKGKTTRKFPQEI